MAKPSSNTFARLSRAAAGLLVAFSLLACASEEQTSSSGSSSEPDTSDSRYYYQPGRTMPGAPGASGGAIDLGENWSEGLAPAPDDVGELSGGVGQGDFSFWTIVLRTFTQVGHQQAAATMAESCAQINPQLGAARPHTTSKGSMVIYGAFDDSQSPDAQKELEWVKGLAIRGRPVFPRAMLTRIDVRKASGQYRVNELMSVRRQYPNVKPLYSLQVAVWGDFESGKLSEQEIQSQAEAYVRKLRAAGYDAYFHHDVDKKLSSVTVGLFNHTAVDAQAGIYSPEVDQLMRKFPQHLVNGEPLLEPLDSKRPELGTRVQTPRLVLVPER